jgi:hypothetical protein
MFLNEFVYGNQQYLKYNHQNTTIIIYLLREGNVLKATSFELYKEDEHGKHYYFSFSIRNN